MASKIEGIDDTPIKLALAVTTLNYQKKCVDSLLSLAQANIFSAYCIPDCCLLPISRNIAVQLAYDNCPDFTHLIFIDDDMCDFEAQHVMKLVDDTKIIPGCDVVSALVTHRNPPYRMVAQFTGLDNGVILESIEERRVLESTHVGLAFTVIKREVLDAIKEETEGNPVWFTLDRQPRINYEMELVDFVNDLIKRPISEKDKLLKAAAFGEQSCRGTEIVGEDIGFCKLIHKLGLRTWVDCGVVVPHLGLVGFDFRHALQEAYNDDSKLSS